MTLLELDSSLSQFAKLRGDHGRHSVSFIREIAIASHLLPLVRVKSHAGEAARRISSGSARTDGLSLIAIDAVAVPSVRRQVRVSFALQSQCKVRSPFPWHTGALSDSRRPPTDESKVDFAHHKLVRSTDYLSSDSRECEKNSDRFS